MQYALYPSPGICSRGERRLPAPCSESQKAKAAQDKEGQGRTNARLGKAALATSTRAPVRNTSRDGHPETRPQPAPKLSSAQASQGPAPCSP